MGQKAEKEKTEELEANIPGMTEDKANKVTHCKTERERERERDRDRDRDRERDRSRERERERERERDRERERQTDRERERERQAACTQSSVCPSPYCSKSELVK